MITEIEDYFSKGCGRCDRFDTPHCSTNLWRKGLARLREICCAEGLEETVKWGQACYMHADRNIVIFGAFQDYFCLGFFNAALLSDPESVLEKQGPNTQHAGTMRFTADDEVDEKVGIIKSYLREAMKYAEDGVKPDKGAAEFELPQEMLDALDADAELAQAFHALTPGRQRSYAINLNGAKKSETRRARIEKFRDKIIAGKGANEY